MSSTAEQIKDIINELLGTPMEEIVEGARFREDLEADSLDLVELIMAFEEKFDTEISDEQAQSILTVGQAISFVEEHKAAE